MLRHLQLLKTPKQALLGGLQLLKTSKQPLLGGLQLLTQLSHGSLVLGYFSHFYERKWLICKGDGSENPCGPTCPLVGRGTKHDKLAGNMFLKRRTRNKDGKTHVYYSVCESVRISRNRTIQRQILHLGELNTTQVDSWQQTLRVLHEDGQSEQLRLFSDREASAPKADDVIEVKLSSFAVKSPRRFGDCWTACQLWTELGLDEFWKKALADCPGDIPWEKVLELLVVNRLLAPRSELFVHEKWFPQTAMDILLETDARVADKDRLYRCLDRLVDHKAALEQHLAKKWKDLWGPHSTCCFTI